MPDFEQCVILVTSDSQESARKLAATLLQE